MPGAKEQSVHMQNSRKVVVTGLGTVNPVGLRVPETWENLLAGNSGIRRIQAFDPEEWGLSTHIAGEVKGFDPEEYMDRKRTFGQIRLEGEEKTLGT